MRCGRVSEVRPRRGSSPSSWPRSGRAPAICSCSARRSAHRCPGGSATTSRWPSWRPIRCCLPAVREVSRWGLGAPPSRHADRPHRAANCRVLRRHERCELLHPGADRARSLRGHRRGPRVRAADARPRADHGTRRAPRRSEPTAAARPRTTRRRRRPRSLAWTGEPQAARGPQGRRRRRRAGDRAAALAQPRGDRGFVRVHGFRHRRARLRLRRRRACPGRRFTDARLPDRPAGQPRAGARRDRGHRRRSDRRLRAVRRQRLGCHGGGARLPPVPAGHTGTASALPRSPCCDAG